MSVEDDDPRLSWALRRRLAEKPEGVGEDFQRLLTIIAQDHDDPRFQRLRNTIARMSSDPHATPLQIDRDEAIILEKLFQAASTGIDARMRACDAYDDAEANGKPVDNRHRRWAEEFGIWHLARGQDDSTNKNFKAGRQNLDRLRTYLYFLVDEVEKSGVAPHEFGPRSTTRNQRERALERTKTHYQVVQRNTMITSLERARESEFVAANWPRTIGFPCTEVPLPKRDWVSS